MSGKALVLKKLKKELEKFSLYGLWDTGINWRLNNLSNELLESSHKLGFLEKQINKDNKTLFILSDSFFQEKIIKNHKDKIKLASWMDDSVIVINDEFYNNLLFNKGYKIWFHEWVGYLTIDLNEAVLKDLEINPLFFIYNLKEKRPYLAFFPERCFSWEEKHRIYFSGFVKQILTLKDFKKGVWEISPKVIECIYYAIPPSFEEDANIYQIIEKQVISLNNFFKIEYNDQLFNIEEKQLKELTPIITNSKERYQNYCLLINKIIFEKLNFKILQVHLSKVYNFVFSKDFGKVNTIKKALELENAIKEGVEKEINKIRNPKNQVSHEIIEEKENYFLLQDEISLAASNMLYWLIFNSLKLNNSYLDFKLIKFYERNPYECKKIFLSLNFPF